MTGPCYDPDGQPISFEQWLAIDATQYELLDHVGAAIVSTQYIGMSAHQPPLIYETLVIGGTHNGDLHRYATRDEAVAGHQRTVARIQALEP